MNLQQLKTECKRPCCGLDHDDGKFFSAMEWFFFSPPLTTMVFQWFNTVEPSPLNVFEPLVSMFFFLILGAMVNICLEVKNDRRNSGGTLRQKFNLLDI